MKVIMEARQLGGQLASQVGSDILVQSWQKKFVAERLWLQNASSLSSCQTEVPVCQPISLNVSPSVWKSYISGFSNVLAKILSCNAKVVGCYLLL